MRNENSFPRARKSAAFRDGVKKTGAGTLCALFLFSLAPTAFGHHKPDHNPPGQAKGGGAVAPLSYRGGPPPWAPAHGYRKIKVKKGAQDQYFNPADFVLLPSSGFGRCNRDVIGVVLGGAAGGALGTQVGSGSGKTASIIGGTILGALVGGSIGRSMDRIDQNCIGQVLERTPTDRTVVWKNPDTGGEYRVTPTQTVQRPDGAYCREYQTQIVIDGRTEQAYGKACRQPDGSWQRTG